MTVWQRTTGQGSDVLRAGGAKVTGSEIERDPRKSLLISLLALAIPVVGTAVVPDLLADDIGLLIWILPLVPAFLLSFHHGWRGASVALAAGMAALALAQSLLAWSSPGEAPPTRFALIFIVVLLAVSLGSGWIASAFKSSLRRAESEALTDQSTGLPNRRAANALLEKVFFAAQRGTRLSVVLFDIDRFKTINDEHGHATGDQVLRLMGTILQSMTRQMNLSARHGGEEFLSVLNQTDAEGAAIFADRVRQAFASADGPAPGRTVSAGIAEYEEGMASPDVLVAAADQALYRAKQNGRNRVEVLGRMGRRVDLVPSPSEQLGTPVTGRGERILVVDDDQAARRGMARGLQRIGYSVLEADSAVQALKILRGIDEPVDLVVTDIVMPDVGGFRLMQMISEMQPGIRSVYVSGYSQEEVDWAGVPSAAWAFISKPISLEDLGQAVSKVLRHKISEAGPTPERDRQAPLRSSPEKSNLEWLPPVLGDTDAKLRGAHVGVLQGSPTASFDLLKILSQAGFQNVQAMADIAELEGGTPWDLIVLDLESNASQAITALSRLMGRESSPALVITATGESQRSHLELLGLGLVEMLPRPVNGLFLAKSARNLLRIRSQEHELRSHRASREATALVRAAERKEAGAEILRRLARAAEYRDELTADHAERVGRIAGAIASELGWTSDRRILIEEAAILHDVGKIAVPDVILRKPDRLTPAETLIMQEHTIAGGQILSGSRNPILMMAAEIALSHHERWDGKGYPFGLRGVAIPESGRIVAVADSFDTMIHLRPYRGSLKEPQAVDQLVSGSGGHYDPDVVQAFLRVRSEGGLREAVFGSTVAYPDAPESPGPPKDETSLA